MRKLILPLLLFVLPASGNICNFCGPATTSGGGGGGGGSGSVTSVGLLDGSTSPIFSISGSPVTSSGVLTETLFSQPSYTFFGNNTTSSSQPTFNNISNLAGNGIYFGGGSLGIFPDGNTIQLQAGLLVATAQGGAAGFPNESANLIFAGPSSGGAAQPTFRTMVLADTPNSSTSGTSNLISRDVSGNTRVNNVLNAITVTVSTGGNIALAVTSPRIQRVTGTTTETLTLANATGLPTTYTMEFINDSTQTVTINYHDNSLLTKMLAGQYLLLTMTDNSTTNGTWDLHWFIPAIGSWSTAGLAVGGSLSAGANNNFQVATGGSVTLLGSSLIFNNNGSLTIAPPPSISSYGLVWPPSQGANNTALTNDGNGNLSWKASSGGTGTLQYVGLIDSTNLFNISSSPAQGVGGSLTLSSFKNESSYTFFGNDTNSSAAPTFANLSNLAGNGIQFGGGSLGVFPDGKTIQLNGSGQLVATATGGGGGGGITTVGPFSASSQANGATIAPSTTITFGPADGTNPGMVSESAQTMGAGDKTFTGNVVLSGSSLKFTASATTLTVAQPSSYTSYGVVLPTQQGATNTLLTNNGNGILSWSAGSSLINFVVATKSSGYSILPTDNNTVFNVNTTGGSLNFSLPNPATASSGFRFWIKDAKVQFGINTLSIVPFSSELIDNVGASLVLSTFDGAWMIYTDGVNWFVD